LLLLVPPLVAQPRIEPVPGDYRLVNGKVDSGTYTGWRIFHTACFGCHGVGGVGTDIAPNLVERVQQMTPRAFATKVLTSYRIVPPISGANSDDSAALREAMLQDILRRERGVGAPVRMPAWEFDPDVNPHVLDLFAYLSARADGLGPGKPELIVPKRKKR
ncbi:MAG: c-type cytochrome, partial [Burkholderiaceae bacterium]